MDIYTVTRLSQEVRSLLEENFSTVWVEGEISNLARPRSGHIYFSLKDDSCQVRCALFRMHGRNLDVPLEDGVQVLVRARASLYPQRGDFQLIVEHLEAAGEGALQRAFEILKKQLAAQGLFDTAAKKPLPTLPRQIGVVTSPSGAAIRDVLAVLKRRFPGIPVLVYPVSVQGREAVPEIVHMLSLASRRRECDVLILTRGGGSLEDLWAFNEEAVAQAIYRCEVPVVSAVGHEIDFTIADFVADRRAPTPSSAAELVTPDQEEWRRRISMSRHRNLSLINAHIRERRQEFVWLAKRLIHPRRRFADNMQRLDELMHRLMQCMRVFTSPQKNRLTELLARLYGHQPSAMLQNYAAHQRQLAQRLFFSMEQNVAVRSARVATSRRALDALGPQRTLERGYAIVTKPPDRGVLRDKGAVREGDKIQVRLAKGTLTCKVVGSG